MKWLTRAAIAAPALHLLLCYYYLFLRSFGFGSSVAEFVSAGDVFTVGLSKLLSTYLLFLAGTLLAYLWMDADPLKITGKSEFELHPSLERPTVHWLFRSMPYVAAVGIVVSFFLHNAVPLLLITFVLIPAIAKGAHGVIRKNELPGILAGPIILIFIGLSNLTWSAYGEGFRFRHRPVEFFADHPRCTNGAVVLFSTSDRYIGVSTSGQRLLLTKDCKVTLRFPRSMVDVDVL